MYAFKPYTFVEHEVQGTDKPKARSGHRIVCNEKNLYSFGGYNPDLSSDSQWSNTPLFKELWKFNFATKKWKLIPSHKIMPNEVASNTAVLMGSALLIHGGTGHPFGANCNNNVYICNVNNGDMQVIPVTGDLPDPQYGQGVFCDGYYLYTIGGTTGLVYTCDIHRLNLKTQVWESVYICSGGDSSEPESRYRHELAFDGKNIYVLGGGTASEAYGFEQIPTFNVYTKRWTKLNTRPAGETGFPAPRRCHGLVQYTDDQTGLQLVVMSGGYNGSQVFNDIWRLDLKTLQWVCLKIILPRPTYFHSATLTPSGQMFTFGGIVKEDDYQVTRTDQIHSVWLTVPKLSEICWEALNFYYPSLKNESLTDLLKIGIPLKFVQRLEHD